MSRNIQNLLSCLLLTVLTTAVPTTASARPPGTEFEFSSDIDIKQMITPGTTLPFQLDLPDSAFYGNNWNGLHGGEKIDIAGAGLALMTLSIKKAQAFTLSLWMETSPGQNLLLDSKQYNSPGTIYFDFWQLNLPGQALDILENDRKGNFSVRAAGTNGSAVVDSSFLGGNGVVVPEPLSLLLLGGGLAAFKLRKDRAEQE